MDSVFRFIKPFKISIANSVLLAAFLFGVLLRTNMLQDQIILDDEWHALDFVSGKSFSYLFSHFGSSANCVPLNLYSALLLKTVGWSELWLKIPSLFSGIVLLALLPSLMKRIFRIRVALFFSYLLAISPLLIFYSRISRAYSTVCLFSILSIFSLYYWVKKGDMKFAALYIFTGVMSIFFHLFSIIAVLSPCLWLLLIKWLNKSQRGENLVPSCLKLILIPFVLILCASMLLLPSLINSTFPLVPSQDQVGLDSALGIAFLLSGTNMPYITAFFIAVVFLGQIVIFMENSLLGGMFLSVLVFYGLAMLNIHHYGIDNAIEIVRFAISIVPICLILFSLGIDKIACVVEMIFLKRRISHAKWACSIGFTSLIGVLFLNSPLLPLYSFPNNFTNHSAFQESYKEKNWDKSYESEVFSQFKTDKNAIPKFYYWIKNRPSVTKIIEYPMYIGDYFNLYYFYQHYHKKPVTIGYNREIGTINPSVGIAYGNMTIDFPLSRVDKNKLAFRNFIDMTNLSAIKKSGAQFLILHNHIMVEMFSNPPENERVNYSPAEWLGDLYKRTIGTPFYEDKNIVVFKLK